MKVPSLLSRGLLWLWVLSLASLLVANPSLATASAESGDDAPAMVRLPGHVLPALSKATTLSPTDHSVAAEARQPLTLTIVLKRDHQAAFESYLHDLYDPHSKNFHHFLSQREIAKRFGPSRQTYDAVLGYLRAKGFHLIEGSKNRLTLTVRGTREQAEKAFGVGIRDYRIGKRKFYANDGDPGLPLAIAPLVQAVNGLSNYAQPRPAHIAIFSAFCAVSIGFVANLLGLDPNTATGKACILSALAECINSNATAAGYGVQIVAQYPPCNILGFDEATPKQPLVPENSNNSHNSTNSTDLTASPWQSATGAGETIGLAEFDNFNSSDVSDYLALVGLPATAIGNLSEVNVDGGTPIGSGEDEVLLDIDTVMTIAPGAKVAVYDAPFTGSGGSFQNVFNKMIDGGVSIISNSWAYCEDETTAADVDSIDSIFQNAAASSISVFNGAGDSGSTCLDGSANTVAVPADSPHATAVGGSSLTLGPGYTYGTETYWDDSATSPPAGEGGFGTSKFFSAPSYQSGDTNRSVPDVVSNADPFHGVEICQADDGGCPNGLQFGGTSMAAPAWAGYTALLNQSLGTNLGFLNPTIYPLAGTAAFHDAASMDTDTAHVGLGSPNLEGLHQMLASETPGPVDASVSEVIAFLQNGFQPAGAPAPTGEPADGTSESAVTVNLFDSNGNAIGGKTVTVTDGAGHATITPPNAVTASGTGAATFILKDTTPETLTLTARDTTDSVTLGATPALPFVSPVATQAGLNAFPSTVTANGMSQADITITLEDSLGRPSPGKLIQLTQTGGNSAISGPVPPVTNAAGTIAFTAVDSNNETITYSAVDVTDGNLTFPETGVVTFSSAPEAGCSNTQIAAPGFIATPYATGFAAQNFSFGSIDFGNCPGAWGMAFDSSGDMYVSDLLNGNLYKIPPGGGIADPTTLVGSLGPTLGGLVFDSSGNLFGSRDATTGDFTTGAVMQINPSTGAVIATVASNLTCAGDALSIDPISGDLFTDDSCSGDGSDNSSLWRISGAATGSPTTTVYANLPNTPNAAIAFSPSGDMYIWDNGQGAMVTGTSGPNPPVVTSIAGLGQSYLGMQAFGTQSDGDGQFLIASFPGNTDSTPNSPPTMNLFDLTTPTPSISTPILANGGGNGMTTGPDGCIYVAEGVAVWRITDSSGACTYTANNPAAALALTPATFTSDAAQGSPITLTASFHNATAPTGTPVTFQVMGANPQLVTVPSTSSGTAAFTYVAVKQGVDTITASAPLGASSLNSNSAVVTWGPGTDVTFLTLNASPSSAPASQRVTVTANLTDVSANPQVALAGQTVNFTIGGAGCGASTDSNGNASCEITPSGSGVMTLAANFPGAGSFNPSSDSKAFTVVLAIPATPTATPTPVAGKLKISPKKLNFGAVEVGSNKIKTVKITNTGKVKKKKVPLPILIEMESGVASPFTLTQDCNDDDLGPKSKGVAPGTCDVSVEFAPTAAMKYSGALIIDTNLESGADKSVQLEGSGKEPK
jgi:hypothetical protein